MQLEQELSRARRSNRPLGIVVIDLDRFKPINDTFGHHVGDEVLKEVAQGLCAYFRRATPSAGGPVTNSSSCCRRPTRR
jgi:diguanylate cyclase (GGDEF)-like protein